MAEDEDWLDAEAAAGQLGLPTRLIYAMVRAGDLPALQFPVRIRRRDVHACLERCRIKPGDLAHLDPNRARRAGDVEPPVAASGRPDRRFGRRYGAPPN